jgi:hypothetical protein
MSIILFKSIFYNIIKEIEDDKPIEIAIQF